MPMRGSKMGKSPLNRKQNPKKQQQQNPIV